MRHEERVGPTPERVAKGGLRLHHDPDGNYMSCEAADLSVLAWMDGRELIDGRDLYATRRFLACQLAFRARSGAKAAHWGEQPLASNTGTANMADDYTRIIRTAARSDCELVNWLHDTTYHDDLREPVYANRGRIAEALGRLRRVVEGDEEETPCA